MHQQPNTRRHYVHLVQRAILTLYVLAGLMPSTQTTPQHGHQQRHAQPQEHLHARAVPRHKTPIAKCGQRTEFEQESHC